MGNAVDTSLVISTLLQFQSGTLPAEEAMRRLGLEWRGDLLQYIVACGLRPTLGGHGQAKQETLNLVDALLDAHASTTGAEDA